MRSTGAMPSCTYRATMPGPRVQDALPGPMYLANHASLGLMCSCGSEQGLHATGGVGAVAWPHCIRMVAVCTALLAYGPLRFVT